MVRSLYRSHILVLPLVLLTLILLEQIAEYYLRLYIASLPLRTLAIMLSYGVGFSIATDIIGPWMKRLIVAVRARSRRGAGRLGVWLFLGLCYATLYFAYFRIEAQGVAALLP